MLSNNRVRLDKHNEFCTLEKQLYQLQLHVSEGNMICSVGLIHNDQYNHECMSKSFSTDCVPWTNNFSSSTSSSTRVKTVE